MAVATSIRGSTSALPMGDDNLLRCLRNTTIEITMIAMKKKKSWMVRGDEEKDMVALRTFLSSMGTVRRVLKRRAPRVH